MSENTSGTNSRIELDCLYSTENIWTRDLGNNMVSIGITDRFQKTMGLVRTCWLSLPETVLKAGESFGSIEAPKVVVDLIVPLSGRVIETNQSLMSSPGPINTDPYHEAWMVKIQLDKPTELRSLISPSDYEHLRPVACGEIPGISAEGIFRLIDLKSQQMGNK